MKFKCTDCDFTALFRNDVVKHYRHTHSQLKVYACNQCEFRTCYSHVLKHHLMGHAGIRPYKCSACGYQVSNPGQVRRHILAVHHDMPDVVCENLDLSFEIDSRQFKCAEPVNERDIEVIKLTSAEMEEVRMAQLVDEAEGRSSRHRGKRPAPFLGCTTLSDNVNGNTHMTSSGHCTSGERWQVSVPVDNEAFLSHNDQCDVVNGNTDVLINNTVVIVP